MSQTVSRNCYNTRVADYNLLIRFRGGVAVEGWSPPVLFYPDGTASDASVLLSNERGLTLRVTLRGLTGIARPGEIGREVVP